MLLTSHRIAARLGRAALLTTFCLAFVLAPAPARAGTTIAVSSAAQEQPPVQNGNCTLTEAIQAANDDVPVDACPAGNGADTIQLAPGATYSFTVAAVTSGTGNTALPAITSPITIQGNNALLARSTLAGTPDFRLLLVTAGGELTLNNVTLRQGRSPYGGALNIAGGRVTINGGAFLDNTALDSEGGAIAMSLGVLALNRTLLDGNQVHATGNASVVRLSGGALAARGGTVTVLDSSLTANAVHTTTSGPATAGGAIAVEGGTLTLRRTRLGANLVSAENGSATLGGALYYTDTGQGQSGLLTLENVILWANRAEQGTGGALAAHGNGQISFSTIIGNSAAQGGGIALSGGISLRATILADNQASSGGSNCHGTPLSLGHNLLDTPGECVPIATDLQTSDARLLPLEADADRLLTPLPDSPALDAVPSSCAATDHTGATRTAPCDIGASEVRSATTHQVPCDANPATRATQLIAVFEAAEASAGPARILLAPGCVYTLDTPYDAGADGPSGLPQVTSDIAIGGRGARIERAGTPGTPPFRIITVNGGHLTLSAVTLSNGLVVGAAGSNGQRMRGGAILVRGGGLTLADTTIQRSSVQGGAATAPDGDGGEAGGGALAVDDTDTAAITIVRSTLHGNQAAGGTGGPNRRDRSSGAAYGGAIAVAGQAATSVLLLESTISGNHASGGDNPGWGGGIMVLGGRLEIYRSLLTANDASGGISAGGGFSMLGGRVLYQNTIISGNRAAELRDCDGPGSLSLGFNLLEPDDGCAGDARGDQTATDARLAPLTDNGGWTATHALLPDSPAIDAAEPGLFQFSDQRGLALPHGPQPDIGPYEFGAAPPPPPSTPSPSPSATTLPSATPSATPTTVPTPADVAPTPAATSLPESERWRIRVFLPLTMSGR
jgi:hypothetical protein